MAGFAVTTEGVETDNQLVLITESLAVQQVGTVYKFLFRGQEKRRRGCKPTTLPGCVCGPNVLKVISGRKKCGMHSLRLLT